ncbi:TPA: hypothetical protein DGD59_00020 [Candidatus Collierbacteria bacterium]|nr:hypothetical protein [Candidatus Collierbacteria bacterium]HBX64016.1 hypothetical protein [Candidatus Collierbacteria bacterium]HCW31098.1 hypothetical protein [Candidatus Collierbacteria bacterium]
MERKKEKMPMCVYMDMCIDGRQKREIGLSYFMTERIFESAFHKKYVGGEGEILEKTISTSDDKDSLRVRRTTEEEVLEEYRRYVRDTKAELPQEIRETFLAIQRTENDRE